MNTTVKYISLILVLAAIIVGTYSCNKAKSDGQSSAGETIATSYSVAVVTATRKDLTDNFSQVGTIVAYNDVAVVSETSGRVVKINAEVGDYKKAGDVLVEVDSELKEAAYKVAQVSYEKRKKISRDMKHSIKKDRYRKHKLNRHAGVIRQQKHNMSLHAVN